MLGSASLFHMHASLESDYAILTYSIFCTFLLCAVAQSGGMAQYSHPNTEVGVAQFELRSMPFFLLLRNLRCALCLFFQRLRNLRCALCLFFQRLRNLRLRIGKSNVCCALIVNFFSKMRNHKIIFKC